MIRCADQNAGGQNAISWDGTGNLARGGDGSRSYIPRDVNLSSKPYDNPAVGAVLMGTLSEYLGLRLALALGAIVSGSFWLATRFRHKCMAAGLECSPMAATEGRPCRPA